MTGHLKKLFGLPVAIVAAATATWAILDYLDVRPVLSREFGQLAAVVDKTQEGVNLIQWQVLDQRRRTQGLSADDQVLYCRLSKQLGIRGEGCA